MGAGVCSASVAWLTVINACCSIPTLISRCALQTDGLLDNLWPQDVQRVLGRHSFESCGLAGVLGEGRNGTALASVTSSGGVTNGCSRLLEKIATELAMRSHAVGEDQRATSPFSVHAREAGEVWRGGKMDDVVVVLALVADSDDRTK